LYSLIHFTGQLTALHIGTLYYEAPVTVTLHKVQLHTARYDLSNTNSSLLVNYVEKANCLKGYTGFSCEKCADGGRGFFVSFVLITMRLRSLWRMLLSFPVFPCMTSETFAFV